MNTTKEYAKIYGVTDANFRKWCLALEAKGYRFFKEKKAKNDVRLFQDFHDKPTFDYLKSLLNDNVSLDLATTMVIERFGFGYEKGDERIKIMPKNDSSTDVVPISEVQELRKENEQLTAVLKTLIGEFSDLKKVVINLSEQNQNLLQSQTETLATKEDLTQMKDDLMETITKTRSETHSKKQGFLSKLFN